jgi:asparagine synthase (glutamine-hydrolysing)
MFAAIASTSHARIRDFLAGFRTSATGQAVWSGPRGASFGYTLGGSDQACVAANRTTVLVGRLRVEPLADDVTEAVHEPETPMGAALRLLEQKGAPALGGLRGQFGLVAWRSECGELFAIRDPLGTAPLYYRDCDDTLWLSDDLDAFGERPFDHDYIARFIVSRGNPNTTSTIRAGVSALAAGTWLRWEGGRTTTGTFWSGEDVPQQKISRQEASAEFRRLLRTALRVYIDADASTWAHLSGGLDSSSVVSHAAAACDAEPGHAVLGGTLTFRDSLGNGDESEFVDAVLQRYPMENITVSETWPWQLDECGPPPTDRPSRDYPFFARDRMAAAQIAARHGMAILSGIGPDLYLPVTSRHCADLLWAGRIGEAVRELHACAVSTRRSVWRASITQGFLPLVARHAPGWAQPGLSHVARWFTSGFRKQRDIRRLLVSRNGLFDGRRGRYYLHHITTMLAAVGEGLSNWRYMPGLEMRHPLLHRPLVEFCLRLPLELKTDVYWSKPVLRGAGKGVLPEKVRARAGGSILAPRILWAFRHEQQQLRGLLRSPILADLGCVEPGTVRGRLDSFDVYKSGESSYLYALLSLETWLSAKSGRWSAHGGWIDNSSRRAS